MEAENLWFPILFIGIKINRLVLVCGLTSAPKPTNIPESESTIVMIVCKVRLCVIDFAEWISHFLCQ